MMVENVPWTAKLITGGASLAILGLAGVSLRNKLGMGRDADADDGVDASVKNMVVDLAAVSEKHARYLRVLRKYDPSAADAIQRLSFSRHYDPESFDAVLRSLAHIVRVAQEFRDGKVPTGERGRKVALVHDLRLDVRSHLIALQRDLRGSASVRKTCRAAAADIMHSIIGHARTVILRTQTSRDA